MQTNNYNNNSDGKNIELTIYVDHDQTQMQFDESFTRLTDKDAYYYTDCGNLETPDSLENATAISITGYSQGDYATVYCDPAALTKLWGVETDAQKLKADFEGLFFDSRIYCLFLIDGEEYNGDEYLDIYNYDRAEYAATIAKASGAMFEELYSLLPEHIA